MNEGGWGGCGEAGGANSCCCEESRGEAVGEDGKDKGEGEWNVGEEC